MTKTAIITGAGSGIGLEAVRDLVEQGWTVHGVDIPGSMANDVVESTSSNRFHPHFCDIRDAGAVAATMSAINLESGRVNALIASAGVLRLGPLAEMSVEDFDAVFGVNVRGLWVCVREAMPMIRRAADAGEVARIVLLSSVSALRPKIDSGAYSASKAAVSQLTRVLSVECAKHGILVNALAPGTVNTPMVNDLNEPGTRGNWRPSGPSPIGRIAQPTDIVRVMRFLLSEDAGYVTGTTIPVDGGTQAAFVPPE